MIINDTIFNTDCYDIISELQTQCHLNGINILNKIIDTPNNIQVCCPYHKGGQERRPSAGIKKTDGTFHCLACGEVHSLPEMVSFCLGYSDDIFGAQGWNWLLKNFLTISVENRKDIPLDLSRHQRDTNNTINFVTDEELDKYRQYHPYMWKRGLTPQIVDMFDVGYDEITKCLTFPVRDVNGNTLFIARRSVDTKYFNYPSGVDKPLYGVYELFKYTHCTEVIVCESILDALRVWSFGDVAIALNGLGSDYQFRLLNELPNVRKLILATDMDNAGLTAREKIRQNVHSKLITEFKWSYPGVKDLNDMNLEQYKNLKEEL